LSGSGRRRDGRAKKDGRIVGDNGRIRGKSITPVLRRRQTGKKIKEVEDSMEVAPVSRENGCVSGGRDPEVPTTRSA
jgi:hypothetical protein